MRHSRVRSAAQAALSLALDGDLIAYGSSEAGSTELAVRKLSTTLGLSNSDIRRQLEKGDSGILKTDLYKKVFALAERVGKRYRGYPAGDPAGKPEDHA